MDSRRAIRSAGWTLATAVFLAASVLAPTQSAAAPPVREYAAPARIAPMEGGLLLVSDFAEGLVHVVRASDLAIVRSIVIDGQPVGVAWSRGLILVGNETKGRVEAYNPGGQLVASYGEPGSIRLPNSIVVLEPAGKLLVLDAHEKAIKAFTLDGVYLGPLSPPGMLDNPSAMGFDASRGQVLVSDFGASTSSLFRKGQALVRVIDVEGVEIARFNLAFSRPQGLAADGKGRLYVVESFLAQVRILDAITGTELGVLGGFGSGPGELDLPLDVHYSPADGRLLVTDSRNGRIAAFSVGAAP